VALISIAPILIASVILPAVVVVSHQWRFAMTGSTTTATVKQTALTERIAKTFLVVNVALPIDSK